MKYTASKKLEQVAERYAVKLTPQILRTIQGPVKHDPVARQYLPSEKELISRPEENPDPIGDEAHSPVPGIVHRYPDRVLLKVVHVCAVYCRYCFRREMVGPKSDALRSGDLNNAIDYIASRPEIWEVILTGGDPLVLSPKKLDALLARLEAIDHVKLIRIHTRVPVVKPEAVTSELCQVLEREKPVYIALHCNHAQEITSEVKRAFRDLHKAGCVLLSQSVLLKGVNDNAGTLENLFRTLAENRVKPYYLHHPDLAPGTSHFRLPISQGQKLMRRLLGRVSGICQPHYMLDIPGGHGKIPLTPCYVEELGNQAYHVTDFEGGIHDYPPPPDGEL